MRWYIVNLLLSTEVQNGFCAFGVFQARRGDVESDVLSRVGQMPGGRCANTRPPAPGPRPPPRRPTAACPLATVAARGQGTRPRSGAVQRRRLGRGMGPGDREAH